MNVNNFPKGEETITLPIDKLYKILNNICSKDQNVSIEFIEQPEWLKEKGNAIRFVVWDETEDGHQSICDVMELEHIPCSKNEINEINKNLKYVNDICDRLEKTVDRHEHKEKVLNDGICKGISAIPKEWRWDFIKEFNPSLRIQDGLDLVEDPLNSKAII